MFRNIEKRNTPDPCPLYSDALGHYPDMIIWYVTTAGEPAILRNQKNAWGFAYIYNLLTEYKRYNFDLKFSAGTIEQAVNKAIDAGRTVYCANDTKDFILQAYLCQK